MVKKYNGIAIKRIIKNKIRISFSFRIKEDFHRVNNSIREVLIKRVRKTVPL
jgi:tRNA/tmRNA/rRNA uracil-C5-methylase (TrmA/RlmC/RlmD family)